MQFGKTAIDYTKRSSVGVELHSIQLCFGMGMMVLERSGNSSESERLVEYVCEHPRQSVGAGFAGYLQDRLLYGG